jgi:hypothetical protein
LEILASLPDRSAFHSGDNISTRHFLLLTQATRTQTIDRGSRTTHVAQTGDFSRRDQANREAKSEALHAENPRSNLSY